MRKNKRYEALYRRNKDTGRIIIDIALDDYIEFFHEWDNSVFKKRDMHPELAEFLDICSEDIPLREKLEIVFSINSPKDLEKEELIRISYQNYYSYIERSESRKVRRFIRNSAVLLFISLLLLTAYGLFANHELNNIILKVLLESLLIGGWVFAWEAMHILFLDIIEPLHKRREAKRFLEAEISFKYL